MDLLSSFFGALLYVAGLIFSILWWVLSYLLWGLVWLLLPALVIAFLILRAAEAAFGREVVRAWVKARALRYGSGTWQRLRPWLFALTAAPFRVLIWFVAYAVLHAVQSLLWRPKWTPWQRAWERRYKRKTGGTATSKPAARA